MPASQPDALQRNPNQLDLVSVATYRRQVRASLERVWENVLDWEHLPHLHDTSFSYCELDEAGSWGWRSWTNADHTDHVELCVRETDYVARSYSGGRQVSEIWTQLTDEGEDTGIEVEFLVAGVTAEQREAVGELFLTLYTRLWDEDEQMMRERQRRLEEARADAHEVVLGMENEVLAALPLVFQLGRQEYSLREVAGEVTVTPNICPHLLGPLEPVSGEPARVLCPWHGYIFDVHTRDCVSPAGARCRLPRLPELERIDGQIIARLG